MVQITINEEERIRLMTILARYLSELRMEVADTENASFRQELKVEEEFIKKLIKVLEAERETYQTGA